MSTSRIPAPPKPSAPPSDETRSPLRAKTVATRLFPEELEEVEAGAAKREGKSLAEWLRDTVLREARQRPANPAELILAELSATRYMAMTNAMRRSRCVPVRHVMGYWRTGFNLNWANRTFASVADSN